MIPINSINSWRQHAPWALQSQVEQDLVLSRALVLLYQQEIVRDSLAFRGGTALNKLFCGSLARYSEDIDMVHIKKGVFGNVMTAIRETLDPWLGTPRWNQSERAVKFIYRFKSEEEPSIPLRLKIEINIVEPFAVFGFQNRPYAINNPWYSGEANIVTYTLDELMATKLRALYQRSKGRDLYDLWLATTKFGAEPNKIISAFNHYNEFHKMKVSRAEYERNLILKMKDNDFLADAKQVLAENSSWEPLAAFEWVYENLLAKLDGEPWKRS
jgi:predicted nucleotidyltransferase component of viral defense system